MILNPVIPNDLKKTRLDGLTISIISESLKTPIISTSFKSHYFRNVLNPITLEISKLLPMMASN